MLPGLGGPVGRHARPTGVWFNPVPWTVLSATVVFLVLAIRQVPCVQTDATNAIDGFIRLCYSDIPLLWTGQEFGLGSPPFGGDSMVFPPVLGVILLGVIKVTGWLGADIRPDADIQTQLDGAQIFYAVSMVLLFVFFLAWVLSMVLLGRDSRNGRYRTWDGLLVAASPVVLAAGLISWEILPIGLCAIALVQFAQRRVLESGIILGLAAAAGTMPIGVVVAVAVCLLLHKKMKHLGIFLAAAVITWLVVHVPLLLNNSDVVVAFYKQQLNASTSYGSIWFMLQGMGVDIQGTGALGSMILALVLLVTFAWFFIAKVQPRVGTVVAIVVFITAMLGAAYTPQTALWLLFALVLARPFKTEYTLFWITQVGYYLAIWGYLAGHLTAAKTGPEGLYYFTIGLRLVVELGLVVLFYRDVMRAEGDRLRKPGHSDPIGGVLVAEEQEFEAPEGEPVRVEADEVELVQGEAEPDPKPARAL